MSTSEPAPAPRPVLTAKQAQRARQPIIGMVLSTAVVLAAVLLLLAVNPLPSAREPQDRVDVAAAASTVPRDGALPALGPDVPETWHSNYARLSRLDGVPAWEVGWVVTDSVFAGLRQTSQADPTWLSRRVGEEPAVGTVEVDGLTWQHHTPRDSDEQHLVTEVDGTTIVLTTTGDQTVLEDLARAVAKEIR